MPLNPTLKPQKNLVWSIDHTDMREINLQQKLKSEYLGDEKGGRWCSLGGVPPRSVWCWNSGPEMVCDSKEKSCIKEGTGDMVWMLIIIL